MNTETKPIKRPQCTECGETFMMVGATLIGLAFPRNPTRGYNEKTGEMQTHEGVCPKHKRSLENA